jgi:hypothetical protein
MSQITTRYYVLGADYSTTLTDFDTWRAARQSVVQAIYESSACFGRTFITISTVFIAAEHRNGPFETMITGVNNDEPLVERFATYRQAIEFHTKIEVELETRLNRAIKFMPVQTQQ